LIDLPLVEGNGDVVANGAAFLGSGGQVGDDQFGIVFGGYHGKGGRKLLAVGSPTTVPQHVVIGAKRGSRQYWPRNESRRTGG